MAQFEILDGVEVRVQVSDKGTIYSKNYRDLSEEAAAVGSKKFRYNKEKHSFFLGGNAYYVGPSLQDKSTAEIGKLAKEIVVQDSCTKTAYDAAKAKGITPKWVSCLFLPTTGEVGELEL